MPVLHCCVPVMPLVLVALLLLLQRKIQDYRVQMREM